MDERSGLFAPGIGISQDRDCDRCERPGGWTPKASVSVPVPRGRPIPDHPLSPNARALALALDREVPHDHRRAQPGFQALARRIIEVWGPQPGLGGELSRLLRDLGRFAAGSWMIYLEATPGGLTLARLSDLLKTTTISGPGRARALMTYLRFIGYIEPAPAGGDGRQRLHRTPPAMRAAFHERLRRELEVRAELDPAIPALLTRFDDEAVFNAFFVVLSEVSQAIMALAAPRYNELDMFSERYAGMVVLCELMKGAEPDDAFPPRGPLTFTATEVARRCETSRMQVLGMLKRARDKGFLIPTPDGRERLSEPLLLNLEGLIAGTTDMLVGCARIATGGPPTFREIAA